MTDPNSIKNTLNVIRKALENDDIIENKNLEENILILNQLVKNDGNIDFIDNSDLNKQETIDILNKKLDNVFEESLTKWLDKNAPEYLNKYLKNRSI